MFIESSFPRTHDTMPVRVLRARVLFDYEITCLPPSAVEQRYGLNSPGAASRRGNFPRQGGASPHPCADSRLWEVTGSGLSIRARPTLLNFIFELSRSDYRRDYRINTNAQARSVWQDLNVRFKPILMM